MTHGTLSKYWCFTLNNPANNELPGSWPGVQYAVWQREKGEQGTEHLQGYVVFLIKHHRSWVNKNCVAAHWEARVGNHAQAKHYCTKPHDGCSCKHCEGCPPALAGLWEAGEEGENLGGQGKRNDLVSLKRALDEGRSEADIAQDDDLFPVWARHHKIIPRYKMFRSEHQRNWQTEVVVYWGPPGSGKSRRAMAEAGPGAYWLPKPSSNSAPLYWDGYEGQEHVVIDEFYGWMPRDTMQRVVDRYPLTVACRGYSTPFVAKKVWITSNQPPDKWWKIGLGSMERRLKAPIGTIELIGEAPAPELVLTPNGAHLGSYIPPAVSAPVGSLSPSVSQVPAGTSFLWADPEEIPLTPNQPELEAWFRQQMEPVEGPVDQMGRSQPYEYELFGCEFE